MKNTEELQKIASQIRRDIVRMVHAQSSGHPGGPLGSADLMTALYFNVMDYNPKNFNKSGSGEDLFFLSIGHLSAGLYSTLARSEHFPVSELNTFREINSRLQGHPTPHDKLPGIRVASGSLGQGLSVSIGAALSKKQNNDNKLVYTLIGDGESQEGQIWEAAMFAAHHKVDNLIAVTDYNGKQIDGPVDEVMSLGNLKAKWEAFNWKVIEMEGNDMDAVLNGLKEAKENTGKGKPIMILMKTEMGNGVDFMMGTHKWHGSPPSDEQLENALSQLTETLGDY